MAPPMMAPAASPPITPAATPQPWQRASAVVGARAVAAASVVAAAQAIRIFFIDVSSMGARPRADREVSDGILIPFQTPLNRDVELGSNWVEKRPVSRHFLVFSRFRKDGAFAAPFGCRRAKGHIAPNHHPRAFRTDATSASPCAGMLRRQRVRLSPSRHRPIEKLADRC